MVEKLVKKLGRIKKITETKRQVRLRVKEPKLFRKGSFRIHDVGRTSFTKRIAGKLKSTGKWQTQAWIFKKKDFGRAKAIRTAKMFAKKR